MSDSYTQVSISGYNANPPSDDGENVVGNEVAWAKHKDKIGDPLKVAIEAINTNVDAAFTTVEGTVPPGVIWDYGGTTAPTGFVLCDGTEYNADSDTSFADLFSVIGTTYGGTGAAAFNVPDLRGRVVAGQDDMGGTSANRLTNQSGGLNGDTLGASGGSETHTLTVPQIPGHQHPPTSAQFYLGTGLTEVVQGQGAGAVPTGAISSALTGQNTGGGDSHNNVQPTFILNKIIKK